MFLRGYGEVVFMQWNNMLFFWLSFCSIHNYIVLKCYCVKTTLTKITYQYALVCCLTLYVIVIQGLLGVGFQSFGNQEKLKSSPLQHLFEVGLEKTN